MSPHQSCTAEFHDADRDLSGPLACAEKRVLRWLAVRLPRSINSDHLTALALAAMFSAGLSFWAARFNKSWLFGVLVCLALNWFGDSLDGTVARVRQQQRPRYGFYVDHVVDCFGVLFLFGGLAASGFMSPFVAMALLIAYLMLSIEIYLATYCLAVFRLTFWGCGPTELRILLGIGALALRRDPTIDLFGASYRLFDVGGGVAILFIGVTFVIAVIRNARTLYDAEPLTLLHVQRAR
jgi:archaetidylinositol phosphate synthase